MAVAEVLAKKDAATKWCTLATQHTTSNGGKPWTYLLVPHDAVADNMTIQGLAMQFTCT
jgi:type III restriction enzyme